MLPLHFERQEYDLRHRRLLLEIQKRNLDGILLFRQESLYWLTGYDSLGYIFFQCLYVDCDGQLTLFSRPQDLQQARRTSTIEDVVLWHDREGASPATELRRALGERGCVGKRLGVEWDAFGLTLPKARALEDAFTGFCELVEASDVVSRLRAVKSPAELAHVRRAATLADEALDEVRRLTVPGRCDGDILAALHGVVFRGGGGYPANECILNSGEDAVLLRHHAGRRQIARGDLVLVEFAAPYRRYHVGVLQTILTGRPSSRQQAMHAACIEALRTAEDALRPGAELGRVFDAQAAALDAAGFGEERLHSCGYGLGATFPPTWVDWPMLHSGSHVRAEPGMTLLLLMILVDRNHRYAMGVGRTVLVTDNGCESLSRGSLDLAVNR